MFSGGALPANLWSHFLLIFTYGHQSKGLESPLQHRCFVIKKEHKGPQSTEILTKLSTSAFWAGFFFAPCRHPGIISWFFQELWFCGSDVKITYKLATMSQEWCHPYPVFWNPMKFSSFLFGCHFGTLFWSLDYGFYVWCLESKSTKFRGGGITQYCPQLGNIQTPYREGKLLHSLETVWLKTNAIYYCKSL